MNRLCQEEGKHFRLDGNIRLWQVPELFELSALSYLPAMVQATELMPVRNLFARGVMKKRQDPEGILPCSLRCASISQGWP
jgi:hypothetical protein